MQVLLRICFILLLATGLIGGCKKSTPDAFVDIPDAGFLDALISAGVDNDGDGLISLEEAESANTLKIPPSGIRDLTGLEAFIYLDSLSITLNPLNRINLAANTSLRYLECTSCELSSLDLSNNLQLEELICNRNQLRELDISLNQSLVRLSCKNNLLSSLDLSSNTGLTKMVSCGNQLTRLDISMHPSLTVIGLDNMPMLTEVCVWTLPFPPDGVTVIKGYSPNIIFITTCSR